jgi:hypothetical protein
MKYRIHVLIFEFVGKCCTSDISRWIPRWIIIQYITRIIEKP